MLLLYTKKVWSRFVYSKRGSDKTREKINGNNPHTRIDCVKHTKPNTDDGAVVYPFCGCIYNHRTTKTNQKYPSVNL